MENHYMEDRLLNGSTLETFQILCEFIKAIMS